MMTLEPKPISVVILGVDPGLVRTGYGILRKREDLPEVLDYGVIHLPEKSDLPERLAIVHRSLKELIERYEVNRIATETQFVAHNVASTLKLGMVRGVTLALAALLGIEVLEYSPTRIKKAATGRGLATKAQIQFMVKARLRLEKTPPEDAADALAIALCHLQTTPLLLAKQLLGKQKERIL